MLRDTAFAKTPRELSMLLRLLANHKVIVSAPQVRALPLGLALFGRPNKTLDASGDFMPAGLPASWTRAGWRRGLGWETLSASRGAAAPVGPPWPYFGRGSSRAPCPCKSAGGAPGWKWASRIRRRISCRAALGCK